MDVKWTANRYLVPYCCVGKNVNQPRQSHTLNLSVALLVAVNAFCWYGTIEHLFFVILMFKVCIEYHFTLLIILNMYYTFIKLHFVEPPSTGFPSLWCSGCVWGRSSLFLLTAVFQIVSETQLKSLHSAALICHPFRSVVHRRVCLPAKWGTTMWVALVLVSNTRTWRMFAPFCLFFLSRKWSSLHKGLVNPFKYALQTLQCVMLTATLVTYIVSPRIVAFKSFYIKWLRLQSFGGLCAKNMISNPHWDYFWHTTKSFHFAVLIYLH